MHKVKHFKPGKPQATWSLSVCNATMVIALGIISSLSPAAAYAQSTSAAIFGKAPAGEIVIASSTTGLHRRGTVNKAGRYKIGPLPEGSYTVTLEKGEQTVATRSNIALLVGRNAEIDFACPNDHCAALEDR